MIYDFSYVLVLNIKKIVQWHFSFLTLRWQIYSCDFTKQVHPAYISSCVLNTTAVKSHHTQHDITHSTVRIPMLLRTARNVPLPHTFVFMRCVWIQQKQNGWQLCCVQPGWALKSWKRVSTVSPQIKFHHWHVLHLLWKLTWSYSDIILIYFIYQNNNFFCKSEKLNWSSGSFFCSHIQVKPNP